MCVWRHQALESKTEQVRAPEMRVHIRKHTTWSSRPKLNVQKHIPEIGSHRPL